jgi:hypothetical protein
MRPPHVGNFQFPVHMMGIRTCDVEKLVTFSVESERFLWRILRLFNTVFELLPQINNIDSDLWPSPCGDRGIRIVPP